MSKLVNSVVHGFRILQSDCPYCGARDGATLLVFWAHSLAPDDYGALLDRGFCRSGSLVYLSLNDDSCCKLFSMRVKAAEWRPSRSQRRARSRLQRALAAGFPHPIRLWRWNEPGYDAHVAGVQASAAPRLALLHTAGSIPERLTAGRASARLEERAGPEDSAAGSGQEGQEAADASAEVSPSVASWPASRPISLTVGLHSSRVAGPE